MLLMERRVLAGRQCAPEIVTSALKSVKDGAVVLDIGPGTGRLKDSVLSRTDLKFVGLEYDFSLCPDLLEKGYVPVVNADANKIPLSGNNIDVAVAINVFHEVCGSQDYTDRLKTFDSVLNELSRVSKDDGELIIFEGVNTIYGQAPVKLFPKSAQAEDKLTVFATTYEAQKINLQKAGDFYVGDLMDVLLLQTKYGYIGTEAWEGERRQLYPFINKHNMLDSVTNAGFKIVQATHPTGRVGVEKFLKDFDVILTDKSELPLGEKEFPQSQIFIHCQKQ